MADVEIAASPIEFVADGRIYEPTGRSAGEFIAVFGDLVVGPPCADSGAIDFPAELVRPDGTTTYVAGARLDCPVGDEAMSEGPFILLFRGIADEVPAGTRIVSRTS
jgi:hypothetical protein